jgi:probable rRNA maturation factor
MVTTKDENNILHSEWTVPFVVSLSNHERYMTIHPSLLLRANGNRLFSEDPLHKHTVATLLLPRYDLAGVKIMLKIQLSIRIEKPFVGLVSKVWLRQAVKLTLIHTGISSPVELGLVIAGDDTVHELNRSYRNVDRTTDVIAFALSEQGANAQQFITPPDDVIHLGEVIISYPQAERQSEEQRHPLEKELALLVAHGVLHLLGYDHELPEQGEKMRAMESRVLDTIKTI